MTFGAGRILSVIAALAAVGAGWYFAAPTQLGGSDSYVQIYGTSMNPRFHAGDLVIVRSPGPNVRVGDIVAYKNAQLGGQVVMHRIIRIAGDRYVFKGDNNTFIDSYHPTRSELVGRLWLHVPAAGSLLVWLHGRRLGLIAGTVALLAALLGAGLGGKRLRGRERPASQPTVRAPRAAGAGGSFGPLAAGAGIALLGCAALAALSFTKPLTTHVAKQDVYEQNGRFSYDADAPGGARIYGSTAVKTGQPLFLRLVHSAKFHFAYDFSSATPHAVNGTVALDALLTGSSGWKRTLRLVAPTSFSGDRSVVTGGLSFRSLTKLLEEVDALTNANGGTYTLTLAPHVQVRGIVAGNAVQDHFSPTLPLTVDSTHVQLQPGGAAGAGASAALTQTASGSGLVSVGNRIALLKFGLSVSAARRVSLVGGALAAILLLLAVVMVARSVPADEAQRIARDYAELIVPVESLPASAARIVRTSSIDGLVRIAEQSGRMVMHAERAGLHTYFVEEGAARYVYEHRAVDRPDGAAAIRLARPGA